MTDNVLSCTKTLKMEAGVGGSGLIVSVRDTRSRDMVSSPSQRNFVVFLDKTLLSQCLSTQVYKFNTGGNPGMD